MKEKEKTETMASDQEVRNITKETKSNIAKVRAHLEKEWGFKPSINSTLNYILANGSLYILNNQ